VSHLWYQHHSLGGPSGNPAGWCDASVHGATADDVNLYALDFTLNPTE
jgi:hypothetical protein